MRENKLIDMLTKNNVFAFFYIVAFITVIIIAVMSAENIYWVKLAWVMLSILGVFVSLGAYVSYIEASQSMRWPTVSAKLLSTRVSSGSNQQYTPVVEYEFSYMGKLYTGNTIDYSAMSGSEAWATKVIMELQKQGIGLQVSVNPDDPMMNVLKPGIRLVHYLRYLIGPAMIIVGAMGTTNSINLN